MKNVVITGGSRGIGRELGLLMSKSNRVLLLSRNEQILNEIKKECKGKISVRPIDLTTDNAIDEIGEVAKQELGHVDILINNAGFLVNKPFVNISASEIKQIFQVNVFGLMAACKSIIPLMPSGSHIVNVGSMGGFQGSVKFPGLSVYSASKSAVAGFSEALAEELKDAGIAVNCLALGAAQTEMLCEAFPGYAAPVSAAEMAKFITDFSLTGNKWINGKVIPVSLSTP